MGRNNLKNWLPALMIGALTGCADDSAPDPNPQIEALFWEPRSVCLPVSDISDTLFVTNFEDSPLQWMPTHVPAGSINLDDDVTIQPETTVGILWTWAPGGTGIVTDSLVVETDDPASPRVVIPFRRESSGYVDDDPPPAPVPAQPDEGATFQVGDSLDIAWSRVSDCSGIARYELQIAGNPQFTGGLFSENTPFSGARVEVETGDEGPGYWRVRARDNVGLASAWSPVRSWTVE
jgi:hypothetical protein